MGILQQQQRRAHQAVHFRGQPPTPRNLMRIHSCSNAEFNANVFDHALLRVRLSASVARWAMRLDV